MTTGQISPTEYQQQPKISPSPTEPPSRPKNKLLLPLILTLFLLLITLIVGGVFALKYYTTPQTTTLSIENQPIPPTSPFNTQSTPSTKNQPNSTITPLKESPSPTPDLTANWKTYINKEYGFEFKYPKKVTVKKDVLSGQISIGSGEIIIQPLKKLQECVGCCPTVIKKEQTTFAFKKATYIEAITSDCNPEYPLKKFSKYMFEDNGQYINVIMYRNSPSDNQKTVMNQILSTFKFLD